MLLWPYLYCLLLLVQVLWEWWLFSCQKADIFGNCAFPFSRHLSVIVVSAFMTEHPPNDLPLAISEGLAHILCSKYDLKTH